MKLEEYLIEVEIGDRILTNYFNIALKYVFNQQFLNKIENMIKRRIHLKEVRTNKKFIAYNVGNTIVVNLNEFEKLSTQKRIEYLLHEFIHMLQRKKYFLFFRRFKEIVKLTKELKRIVKNDLTKPLSVFLTGKNVDIGAGGYNEILAYLMNNTIDWSALTFQGRRELKEAIRKSGLFNLNTSFWRKRLS